MNHTPLLTSTTDPRVSDRVVYVPADPFDVYALLSEPRDDVAAREPILLIGPWGWEDISAHRPLRTWAHHLARRGHPVLRIDLPGSGDSAGDPKHPDLVGAWRAGILAAATALATSQGAPEVRVIALGLPGLVVVDGLRHDDASAIGDVALWGVASRGRTVIRQLQAFAQLERSTAAIDEHGEQIDDVEVADSRLAPGGYLLTDETQAGLRATDATTVPAEVLAGRRVLLLERDGMAVDAKLRAHLEASGATVSTAHGDGYGRMVEHPQTSTLPAAVVTTVDGWLDEVAAAPATTPGGPLGADTLDLDGVRESPLRVADGGPGVFGIVSEPDGPRSHELTVVFLNAGGQRHVGPNRMWVEAARRWAAGGVPSVRIDVGSLGDAPGPDLVAHTGEELHNPTVVAQVRAALDLVVARGLPSTFMIVGLCSGAWMGFNAALGDPRVRSTVLINARALVWSSALGDVRDARVGKRIVKRSQWKRVLRGDIERERIIEILKAIANYPVGAVKSLKIRRQVTAALQRQSDAGVLVSLIFTGNEPLRGELERDGALDLVRERPGLQVVELAGRDHSLRPMSEQQLGHELLDADLRRVLAAD
ncbi:alpha/beta hydrolase [Patulibacter minatonensis]|uniref:alpha/beta hydrolase n=1 Tax=Patulibacter minatonensis TaxID=298163 RepID=UPI00047E84FC|nr:alpha/beta hydrolase [Patulibacter minatonensis]